LIVIGTIDKVLKLKQKAHASSKFLSRNKESS